jgi:hypothetical protein
MDLESPDSRAKFYALQVLVSAYGHLGRTDQTAAALERFRKVVTQRLLWEPNQLITQDFMVFKNTADIERLLAGLTKAGVPDLPPLARAGMNPKDRLTGAEIKSLMFGHETRGKFAFDKFLPMQRTTSVDGAVSQTFGLRTNRNLLGARQFPLRCLSRRADKLWSNLSQCVQDAGARRRIQGRLPLGPVRVFGRQVSSKMPQRPKVCLRDIDATLFAITANDRNWRNLPFDNQKNCTFTDRCPTEGVPAAEKAIEIDRALDQRERLPVSLMGLGQIHQCHGRPELAVGLFHEALDVAAKRVNRNCCFRAIMVSQHLISTSTIWPRPNATFLWRRVYAPSTGSTRKRLWCCLFSISRVGGWTCPRVVTWYRFNRATVRRT